MSDKKAEFRKQVADLEVTVDLLKNVVEQQTNDLKAIRETELVSLQKA